MALTTLSLLALTCLSYLYIEDWPAWRGPRGDGSSDEQKIAIEWDGESGKNIKWFAPLPGVGHSSPIVWKDEIFLTSCLLDTEERLLLCLDRKTGAIKWQKLVLKSKLESIHSLNSRASGTPTTDGNSIFVAFMRTDGHLIPAPNVGSERDITQGEMVVAAYTMTGDKKWEVIAGDFISAHGFSSCPVLYQDLVIVNGDHDGKSYVVAYEKSTGKERWRRERKHGIRSYCTPLLRQVAGRDQLVMSGSKSIVGMDPGTGEEFWRIEGPTDQFVASMVFDGERFFMACGYPDYYVAAVKADGKGDVTESAYVWKSTEAKCYVPSPVVLNGFLIVADDRGTGNCFSAATGERYWQARLSNGFNPSLIHADGLVYMCAQDGETIVLRPGKEVDIVAKNKIDDVVMASPAISQGSLFIRGEKGLYCIENK